MSRISSRGGNILFTPNPSSFRHFDRSVPGLPTSPLSTTATYAALREERRTTFTDLTTLHRKSGATQWRDLRFLPTQNQSPLPQPLYPFVISTGAYPNFLPRRSRQRPRMRLSAKRAARTSPMTQPSTGNPGERSGEICGSAPPPNQSPLPQPLYPFVISTEA